MNSKAFLEGRYFSRFLTEARNQGEAVSFSCPDGDPLPPATLSETRARNALPHPRSGLNLFTRRPPPPHTHRERPVTCGV